MTKFHFKKEIQFLSFFLVLLLCFFSAFSFSGESDTKVKEIKNEKEGLAIRPYMAQSYDPIFINGSDPTNDWDDYDVITGSGTYGDPYVIENLVIDCSDTAHGIDIRNTDAYLTIRYCTIQNGTFNSRVYNGINLNNCSNVNISHNKLNNNEMGIRLTASSNVTISRNNCSMNDFDGIRLYQSNNNTVSENDCTYVGSGGEAGIFLYKSNHTHISDNNCSYSEECKGIKLDKSNNNTLTGNNCSNNANGIWLRESMNNTLIGEECSHNSYDGIKLGSSSRNTLIDNTFLNNTNGINLYESSNNTFSGTTMTYGGIKISLGCYDNQIDTSNKINGKSIRYHEDETDLIYSGEEDVGQLILINCNNSIFEDLKISETSTAIILHNSNNNLISGNNCTDNKNAGIMLKSSTKNEISGNNCSENSFAGISLGQSSNNNTISDNLCEDINETGVEMFPAGILIGSSSYNTISGNNCSNNTIGVSLTLSMDNTISDNIFSNNAIGILLNYNANNNTVSDNTCTESGIGIYAYSSSDNTIWKNIFAENTDYQALSEETNGNDWDNGELGNYWGDYSDLYPEASNDGTIWDTPYKINGTENTYDNYPLVQKLNDDNDITDPGWEKKPSDQTLDYGEPFSYQVNASDNVAIDEYWIEGSKDFQIDENGLITNATILSADIYEFTVVVNDTSGNENFATMKVAVLTPTEKGDGINNSEISIPGYTPSLLVIIGLIGATFAIRKFYLKRFN